MWLSKYVHFCCHDLHFYFCIPIIQIHLKKMQQSPALWFIHLFCVSSLTIACLGCMSLVLLVGFRKSYGHTISVYVVTTLDVVMPYSGYFVLFVLDIFWKWHLFAYAEYLWHGVITGHVQKLARFCQFGFWNGSMLFAVDKITLYIFLRGTFGELLWFVFAMPCQWSCCWNLLFAAAIVVRLLFDWC